MKPRVIFIDALRFVASVQMIQGHTIDAVLADVHRSGSVFTWWMWLRGLTAPAFLMSAGFAVHLVDARALRAGQKPASRGKRAAQLFAIGYALHFPAAWFFAPGTSQAELASRAFAAVDILHCNAVCLLCVELMVALRARAHTRVAIASVLVLLTWCTAARLWHVTASFGAAQFWPTAIVGNYLTVTGGSLFPCVPWAGYFFFGLALAPWVLAIASKTALRLAIAALVCVALGKIADFAGLADSGLYYSASLPCILARSGWVLAIASVLSCLVYLRPELPAWVVRLSGESLVLYVVHLLALFSAGVGLGRIFHHRLSVLPSIVLAFGLLMASFAFAWRWSARRVRRQSSDGRA